MATNRLGGVLGRLREAGGTDHELLGRFVSRRDPAAFETLLARHGPMVLAVCRRALADPAAAEDAFQATFLVFLRKAGTVRRGDLLGNWLYGVACRTAARVRADAARRRSREGEAPVRTPPDPLAEITARELIAAVDAELLRLPARYRTPLVACHLDGKTRDEAAAALGWSVATLGRRLARGRELLRARLARRGVALSAALLPASLAPAVVSSALAAPVLTAAGYVAGGQAIPVGAVPAAVETLSGRVVGTMFVGKLKATAAALLAAGLVVLGVGSLARGVIPGPATVATAPGDTPGAGAQPPANPKGPRDHFPAVLDAVRAVESKTERVVLLIRVAQARAAAGDAVGATEDLRQALDLADGLDGDTPRGMALREIAQTRLRLGDVTGALAVADKFKAASHRNHLLFLLAVMQAEAGDIPAARKTAAAITDDQRDGAVEAVGQAEARAGDVAAAVRTADSLKHQPLSRAGVLSEVALAQAKAGDRKAASASLAESLRLSVATLADAGQRDAARAEAAVRQARIGDVAGALRAAVALGVDDRTRALGQIAVEQARQGDVPGAVKTLGEIRDADARTGALLDLARAQADGKDRAGAVKSLAAATDLAATLPAAGRAEWLDNVRAARASLQVAAGDVPGALETAAAVTDGRARFGVLLEVGRAQMKAGDRNAARATFGRAMRAADGLPEGRENPGFVTLVPAWALIKGSVVRQVAAAATEAGGAEDVRAWATGQKSPFVKVMAQLGAAEGMTAREAAGKAPR
jgi:RNA polymerase sigma factor (sigma-70 family)